MNKLKLSIVALFAIGTMAACGNATQEAKKVMEDAKIDSIADATADSLINAAEEAVNDAEAVADSISTEVEGAVKKM